MEKEQPDSLATVAVVSEKMQQPHSHYAPSEVYSSAEPPPAYMRPPTKSTAVQIARIAGITMITMSVVLGSFILASAWVQARFSCSPESIAAMQAEIRYQQQASNTYQQQQQGEFLKHLQPEALVQDNSVEPKDNIKSLSETTLTKKEPEAEAMNVKATKEEENNSKSDSESGDHDEDDDDYDDDEFPPVHIKLPLQLDLDDIAGTLMQQARSRVSCVVERRRADEVMDGSDNSLDNSTDPQRFQRLSGERVAILCESGNPAQEQQEQEMLTPIIVPLGTVQIPLHTQEANPNYHQYQVHTSYQVPDMQQLPLSDPRGLNHIPPGVLPPELRNLPQLTMEMRPPRMGPQNPMMGQQHSPMEAHVNIEMRQIPIELRHFPIDALRGMRPPMVQEHHQEQPQQQQQVPVMYHHVEQNPGMYAQDQQGPAMMPPPPPPQQNEPQIHEQRVVPQLVQVPQTEQRPPVPPVSQEAPERPRASPFQGIPLEIRRIIQQVPLEIKNIIQHITGESRQFPAQVPDGARRENVQEFKPFPEGARPIPLGPFPLPVEVRNLLEHGNIEGRQRADGSDEQQEAKPFPGPEDEGDEVERNFPVPAEIRNIIHQVVEGRAFPVPRFALRPMRPDDSMEIPMQARAEVSDGQGMDQQSEHQQQEQSQQAHLVIPQQHQQQHHDQEEENRPHYVQPRSIRSVPEPFAHRREKRVRRCACDCAC